MTFARCSRGEKRAASAYRDDYSTPLVPVSTKTSRLFFSFSPEIYKTVTRRAPIHGMIEKVKSAIDGGTGIDRHSECIPPIWRRACAEKREPAGGKGQRAGFAWPERRRQDDAFEYPDRLSGAHRRPCADRRIRYASGACRSQKASGLSAGAAAAV